ncbi:hypothetical protein BDR22DRAFT_524398 [Usnea florida]
MWSIRISRKTHSLKYRIQVAGRLARCSDWYRDGLFSSLVVTPAFSYTFGIIRTSQSLPMNAAQASRLLLSSGHGPGSRHIILSLRVTSIPDLVYGRGDTRERLGWLPRSMKPIRLKWFRIEDPNMFLC